jgi:hypothetical protein
MIALYASVNNKQRKVLAAVFAEPVSASIKWSDIEKLLIGIGCAVVEGSGSRVRFEKDGKVQTFHRPHPDPEAKRYQVRDVRDYLIRLGVSP